jgi:hypothetical protein
MKDSFDEFSHKGQNKNQLRFESRLDIYSERIDILSASDFVQMDKKTELFLMFHFTVK